MPKHNPPILPAIFLFAAAGAWPCFEHYAVQGFASGKPGYDMTVESLSDLGVSYRQVHPLKNHNVMSHRYKAQNFNFVFAGVCFGLAQLYLLFATRRQAPRKAAKLRTARYELTALYLAGMIMVSEINAGPREKHEGVVGWHWTGLSMVAIAGNLNSVLAGAASDQTGHFEGDAVYRVISATLGVMGLFSFYQFHTLGVWDLHTKVGMWQRGMIYPILAWEAVTAVAIVTTFKVFDVAARILKRASRVWRSKEMEADGIDIPGSGASGDVLEP